MKNIFSQRFSFSFFIAAAFLLLAGCRQIDVYEMNTPIPKYKWQHSFAAPGTFIIKDTAASYNVSIVLRHTDAYAYNNIWLNVGLQSPGDSMYYQKIDLSLGNDAGGWEGAGMNDIWEVRKLLNSRSIRFKKAGTYHFRILHMMRDEPLEHVMSAGLRVEKTP